MPAGSDRLGSSPTGGALRRIVPCLDVAGGRVVKGVRFQGLRDVGEPAQLAARYQEEGADEIVLLDIAASPDDRETALEVVRRVRGVLQIPLTAGGGVREPADAAKLLAAGADKVSVNTAAVRRPDLVTELAERFGRQAVVLAIDARRAGTQPADGRADEPRWEVLVRGGRDVALDDAVAWAETGEQLGAGELLVTSWDRDGTGEGPDVDLLMALCGAGPEFRSSPPAVSAIAPPSPTPSTPAPTRPSRPACFTTGGTRFRR